MSNEPIIHPHAHLVGREFMTFGRNVMIDSFSLLIATADNPIVIGDYAHIGSHVSIGGGPVTLGNFTNVGPGSRLLGGSDAFDGSALIGAAVPPEYRKVNRQGITLEDHAVLGANVVVFPGVAIGEGAAVGANSLVKDSLLGWHTYVGSPVKNIGERRKNAILVLADQLRTQP